MNKKLIHSLMLMVFVSTFSLKVWSGEEEEPLDEAETEIGNAINEPPADPISAQDQIEINSFSEAKLTDEEKDWILAHYAHLDPSRLVPRSLLNKAIFSFHTNMSMFKNRKYMAVMDYTPHSRNYRFFIINLEDGKVLPLHAAHGTGSDPEARGWAKYFSNKPGSNSSSLGYIRTGETYEGNHGLSLRLDGLSSTNSNMRNRAVVIHGAQYVWEQNVRQGRSWGCIAVSMKAQPIVINRLKGGALIYSGRSE